MRARTKHSCGSSATIWRHADHSVLLVCAMVAWGTAHGQASPDDAMRLQPAEALAAGGQQQTSRVEPGSQLDISRGFGLQAAAPASRDSLFADDDTKTADKPRPSAGWRGFIQGEAAYSYRDPKHWSKGRVRAELSRQGQFSENVKWKIGARADYDAVYDNSDFYAHDVKRDQRHDFTLRENYLDVSTGNLELRLGRQHVVWGEMVGLFIADVVSARDMREFILPEPELEMLRIPQWAARAEYFMKDMKAEVLWVPAPSFDEIGKPGIPGVRGAAGADFFPYPIPGPGGTTFLGEEIPSRKLSNSNYGARLSALKGGWDMSAFYYHSLDITPTFYRDVIAGPGPAPVFRYQARHDTIDQFGGTFAKDIGGDFVLKGEATYTNGRQFNVTRVSQPNGLVAQDTLDYAFGLDFSFPEDRRLNLQFFQRIYMNHDPDTLQDKYESGVTALLEGKLVGNLEGRALLVHSLNRSEWLFRPRLAWKFDKNWRALFGFDIFSGPPSGQIGRFANNDRVYTELRYTF